MVSWNDLPDILFVKFLKYLKYHSSIRRSNNFQIQLEYGMFPKYKTTKTKRRNHTGNYLY